MSRATFTWLAAAAAVGITTAAITVALATAGTTASSTPAPPVEQAYDAPVYVDDHTADVFWTIWDGMDDGSRFELCLEVWELGSDTAAEIVDAIADDPLLDTGTLADALDEACS